MLLIVPLGMHNPGPWYAGLVAAGALLFVGAAWSAYTGGAFARKLARSRALRVVDTILWNILLAVLLFEGTLTLADHWIDHPLLTRPEGKSVRRIDNAKPRPHEWINGSQTNSRGYNDTEWTPVPPAGTIRILALGDSFAFGVVGYRENFLTQIEVPLSRRLGQPVEVVNLGLTSLMPRDYLYLLNDEGLALAPDIVLVCFFVGNDYNKERRASVLHPGSWRTQAFIRRAYLMLAERQRRAREPEAVGAPTSDPDFDADTRPAKFSDAAYLDIARSYLLPLVESAGQQRIERDTLGVLERIVVLADPRPVVIAMLPTELQVERSLRERVLAEADWAESEIDVSRPVRRMRAHFEPRGVPVIDLLPALIQAEVEGRTYYPRDTHWNTRGNRAAAEALWPEIEPIVREVAARKRAPAR
jgi:hypothetical protein